jgi:hypothetical protein
LLWLFFGDIFLATVSFSWYVHDIDVSYERLASKGFAEAPLVFSGLPLQFSCFYLLACEYLFLPPFYFSASTSAISNVL